MKMPLLPLLMYDYSVPCEPSRKLKRLLDVDGDYPNPFTIQRHANSTLHRKDNSWIIKSDKNTFQVSIDVRQFSAEELSVKSLNDNMIQVEGKHEEKQDEYGLISRHFIRKYNLPKEHDTKHVTSTLSSDGILKIVSRKRKHNCDEKEIPIKLTGSSKPVAITNGTENP